MLSTHRFIMAFAILITTWLSGCTLNPTLKEFRHLDEAAKPSENAALAWMNYALASHGARVQASRSTHGHPPETVINGITNSALWNTGEGWECQFTLTPSYRYGYRYGYSYGWSDYGNPYWEEDLMNRDESAWIEILLPARQKINRVVVQAYYSKKGVRHGLGEAFLQSWDGSRWVKIAEVRDGLIFYPTPRKPEQGKYELTFVPVETDKIRLFIRRGDPKSMRKIQTSGARWVEEHWARIMEIEVTGTETVDKNSTTREIPIF